MGTELKNNESTASPILLPNGDRIPCKSEIWRYEEMKKKKSVVSEEQA